MKETWDTIVAYKLVWLRVLGYVLLPMVVTFLAQTESWSGETWDSTHIFLKWRLLLLCFVPGFSALLAFIDQSLARARDNLVEKRKRDFETSMITRQETK